MAKKIVISENQLKMLVSNRKNEKKVEETKESPIVNESVDNEVVIEKPIINESIERIKSEFKRFL